MNRRFARALSITIAVWALFAAASVSRAEQADPETVFNVESKIYHRASCSAARRCTKNCIVIKLSEARRRGGRACKICGGPAGDEDDLAAMGARSFAEGSAQRATGVENEISGGNCLKWEASATVRCSQRAGITQW